MKTHKLKIILLAFGIVLFSSCTKLLYTSLDVLRPAKVAFSLNTNNLLIVNNSVIQPSNYGHQAQPLNEKLKNISIPNDSAAIFCLSALNEDLETKDFFSTVQLLPNSINSSTEFFNHPELSNDQVIELCKKNNANVILALENIKVNDDLNEYYILENTSYLSSLEVKYETSWSIYYPNDFNPVKLSFKDTLYWESESYNRRKAVSALPVREDALIDGALETGHKSANRFVPFWEKVDRYFFNPNNKLMKQGMDSVYVKNWKSAIQIWEKTYNENKNARIQAQAANNIAIAYEIIGDIDKALEFATKSYYTFGKLSIPDNESFMRISNYIIELNQRKIEIALLKKQVGE
jgi:tetratricopeptide (TPR) repeat protein